MDGGSKDEGKPAVAQAQEFSRAPEESGRRVPKLTNDRHALYTIAHPGLAPPCSGCFELLCLLLVCSGRDAKGKLSRDCCWLPVAELSYPMVSQPACAADTDRRRTLRTDYNGAAASAAQCYGHDCGGACSYGQGSQSCLRWRCVCFPQIVLLCMPHIVNCIRGNISGFSTD